MINTHRMTRMCVVSEPSLQPGNFGYRVNERAVPLSPLVENTGGAAGWSSRRQVVRHVHDAMAEHRTGH